MWRRPTDDERPRVCIVRHNYYPDSHVRRDAEALVESGCDVTVIALRRPGQAATDELNGVRVHRLPVQHRRGTALRYAWEYSAFAFLALLLVSRLHLRKRFRVVEVDNMPDILVLSALVPKLTGTPVILYVFDTMPDLLAYLWKASARHPVVRLLAVLERVSAAVADRVIVTQEMPRRAMIARGVPERKITVVLNCADERVFNRTAVDPAASDSGGFRIVTHGVILERYGGEALIRALPQVAATIPDVQLDIFGEGEHRAALEHLVQQLDLGRRVRFHGFAPLDELLRTLMQAHVGYVGMLNDLVLPNKLMEYVTLGVPVALSRWPTFLHYFPEDSATYFTPGDSDDVARALIEIWRDPAEARQRAARASQRYLEYRWPVQKQVYLGVYDTLMQDAGVTLVRAGETGASTYQDANA
jgi:glycosyltransferase involved in cell wall biosynthesis